MYENWQLVKILRGDLSYCFKIGKCFIEFKFLPRFIFTLRKIPILFLIKVIANQFLEFNEIYQITSFHADKRVSGRAVRILPCFSATFHPNTSLYIYD
jgi:hypothetical protein